MGVDLCYHRLYKPKFLEIKGSRHDVYKNLRDRLGFCHGGHMLLTDSEDVLEVLEALAVNAEVVKYEGSDGNPYQQILAVLREHGVILVEAIW